MRTNWPSVTTYDSNEKFKHLRFAWGRLLCYIIPIPISVQLLSIIFEISGGVQSLSRVHLFMTMWTAACQASLSFTFSWSLLKLMSCEMVMPSNHLILCHHLLLLPSVFPSIKVFSNGLAGVGCHSLLPGIFPTQGWNLDLLHAGRFLTFWDTGEVYIIFLISDTVFCWCQSLIIAITLMHS